MNIFKNRLFIVISLTILLSLVIFSSMLGFSGITSDIEKDTIQSTAEFYQNSMKDGTAIPVTSVNDSIIYLNDIIRLQANNSVNIEVNKMQLKKALQNGDIDEKSYNSRLLELSDPSNIKTFEEVRDYLIRQEIFYQEAKRQGYNVNFDDALKYEQALDEEMKVVNPKAFENYYNYTKALANSFDLTIDEYINSYIVPIRQKHMSIDLLVKKVLSESGISQSDLTSISNKLNTLFDDLYSKTKIVQYTVR